MSVTDQSRQLSLLVRGACRSAARLLRDTPPFSNQAHGGARLAYVDPPFNTGRDFGLFDDRRGPKEWSSFLEESLRSVCDLMAPDGLIFLHITPEKAHSARSSLDRIVGPRCYRNSIVWKRGHATGAARRRLASTYDVILLYGMSSSASVNRQVVERSATYIDSAYLHADSRGRFRYDTLTSAGVRSGSSGEPWRGYDPSLAHRHWSIPRVPDLLGDRRPGQSAQDRIDLLLSAGYIELPANGEDPPRFKRYLAGPGGSTLGDLWEDIPSLHSRSRERVGFPTQKPEALLARIVELATSPGDLILDPFAGSGTTAAVAQKLGRHWVAIEENSQTVAEILTPRLDRVVRGEDPYGITGRGASVGGGFHSIELEPGVPFA